jgi:hypothetical protein
MSDFDNTIYYIIRDKISGKYFNGSTGQGNSTFFNRKKNVAPKLYTIGSAKSVVTQYTNLINVTLDLEIIPVKLQILEK